MGDLSDSFGTEACDGKCECLQGKESKQMTSGCPLVFHYLTECCKEMWLEIETADDRKILSVCWKRTEESEGSTLRQSSGHGRGAKR